MSSPQCAAFTEKGVRCKRTAMIDSFYCWQHQNYVPKSNASIQDLENKLNDLAISRETKINDIAMRRETKINYESESKNWKPKPGNQYYTIPWNNYENLTKYDLAIIMTNGLINLQEEAEEHGILLDDVVLMDYLDSWIDTDSNLKKYFSSFTSKERSEFEDQVQTQIANLTEKKEEFEEWEPERDEYYYGKIPDNVSRRQLIDIMAKGLIKLRDDYKEHGQPILSTDLTDALELWFEHDSNSDDNFDYLVSEDEFEDFEDEVEIRIAELDSM
jgi:hypothetical protein